MKSDLSIRTDGSTEVGLGHLVRCMSLSAILQDQFNITFVCRKIPKQFEHDLKQQGMTVQKIDREEEFLDQLTDQKTVVLDGYSFDSDYHRKVKQKARVLACIDDLHDKEFFADLIINHAPGVTQGQYSAQPYTKYALGLKYALLRPPFLEAALKVKHSNSKTAETILICFGGTDQKNLTLQALNVISNFNQFKKIIIITGSEYRFEDELMRKINNNRNVEYYHALSGTQMAGAFMESDVAIVPSSGILFEALAIGNIAISGMYTDNQKEVYSGFKQLNAIIDAGEFSEDEIRGAIEKIDTYKIPKKPIDGKSPERLQTLFQTIKRD